jgi:hypothetical protein
MRTTIATHELLPKGLYLENLSIETGRVSISAVSGTRRLRCPLCGRGRHLRGTQYPYQPDPHIHLVNSPCLLKRFDGALPPKISVEVASR